jgi:hypothetical protein
VSEHVKRVNERTKKPKKKPKKVQPHEYLTQELQEKEVAREFEWDEEADLASYCYHSGPCEKCREKKENH